MKNSLRQRYRPNGEQASRDELFGTELQILLRTTKKKSSDLIKITDLISETLIEHGFTLETLKSEVRNNIDHTIGSRLISLSFIFELGEEFIKNPSENKVAEE